MKILNPITLPLSILLLWPATDRALAQSYPRESEQLQWATQLLAHSEYQFAAASYEDFIHQYPHSSLLPDAYVGAGDSHFFLKEPDEAMQYYKKYENAFPNGKVKWLVDLREAQCLYLDGKIDEATTKFQSIDPGTLQDNYRPTYYFYLASALMSQGHLKEAGENFEKVIGQKTKSQYTILSYLRLASILDKAGDGKDAAQLYSTAMESGDTTDTQAQLDFIQGITYLQGRQYGLAATNFEKVVQNYPNLPVAKTAALNWFIALYKTHQTGTLLAEYNQRFQGDYSDPLTGPIHLMAADVLMEQKKTDEVLTILDGLINSTSMPEKVKGDAVFKKAKVLADSDQIERALKLLNDLTAADKETQASLDLLKGQCYLSLHQTDKAWDIFARVNKENPDNASAYCYEAHIRHTQNQFLDSAGLFMQCHDKSKTPSYADEALFSAFLMYMKANKLDDAVKASKQYETEYPDGSHLYEVVFNLADLYTQNKKYDQAISILKALPNSSSYQDQREALFQVAYNLQLAGKTQDALKLYNVIINQNTDPQLTLMSLKNGVVIYSQNNQSDQAAQAMYRIVTEFPQNDLTDDDYAWILNYWQQKNDPDRVRRVREAINQRTSHG